MRFLRDHAAPGETVYSNSAPAVYLWTGLRAWPLNGAPRPATEWLAEDSAVVAWFRNEFRESREPEEFFKGAGFRRLAEFGDGTVYRVSRESVFMD
jgi:hypothetical protein